MGVLGVVDSTTSGGVVVVEPGGSTLLGIVVVVVGWTIVGMVVLVVVGWTIVGMVVLVVLVGRAITGVVVDETMAANPMSSSQSLAELPPSHESGRAVSRGGRCWCDH